MRDREPLEQLASLGLGVLGQGEQDVLRADVRRPDLTRLLIGSQKGGLRIRRQRRRHVRALLDVCLLLDLRRDRGGIGADLLQHVPDDLVLGRGPQQMSRVDIQAAPLHCPLSSALEQLARRVAEVLRDVDLLGRAPWPRGRRASGARRAVEDTAVTEEVGEELIEEASAAERRPRRSAVLTLKLAKVLFADSDRPLLAVLPDPNRRDGGPTPVDLAHRGSHENLLAAGASAREGQGTKTPA